MCDFSLKGVASRPARKGDKLTSHNFGTGTNGFRAQNDEGVGMTATAICILPGTELAFENGVRIIGNFKDEPYPAKVNGADRLIGKRPTIDPTKATFIQVDEDVPDTHHDALEFSDGAIVLLAYLIPGQNATVLSLPAKPTTPDETKAQQRVEFAG